MPLDGVLKPRFEIIGGGISGLLAAKKAAEAGYEVHLHEESPARAGGKIESSYFADGSVVNNGAEFIDTDQTAIRELCKELNVPLTENSDKEKFQLAGGKGMSDADFYAALKPVQEKIIRDKAIIAADPQGELAQKLDAMSLTEYLATLAVEMDNERSLLGKIWQAAKNLVTTGHLSSTEVTQALAHIYGSEGGRDPEQISALQYVNEASKELGQFLASDCAFRVKGGTAAIIAALETDLKSKGVQFHMGSKAASATRGADGKFNLTFENGEQAQADKIALALPAKALGNIKGLETLGFDAQDIALLQNCQYTHSAKFSIKLKKPVENASLYSGDGYQSWLSAPDIMTFLVGGEKLNQLKGRDLINYCVGQYAAATATKPDEVFDASQIIFRAPDTQKPCYASPAPGQALALQAFARKTEQLAENGVAVVGTYLPKQVAGSAAIGFMDCGVESVNRAASVMFDKSRDMAMAGVPPHSFVQDIVEQRLRAQTPNLGGLGQF